MKIKKSFSARKMDRQELKNVNGGIIIRGNTCCFYNEDNFCCEWAPDLWSCRGIKC
ncbi:hypothetical protein H5J24_01200 [Chryseobacterium capnotolerans]|uniref:hypothetical protein n=1 Tax=Chryseobacterium TaxID=59732 RepID=UPI000ACEF906|nr:MULTISPECIES: hypothetical protein [Chryseobacterium]UHO38836.1 hypothetical protein H5J24_01200 [Chryseobacterium capnotolerans]